MAKCLQVAKGGKKTAQYLNRITEILLKLLEIIIKWYTK